MQQRPTPVAKDSFDDSMKNEENEELIKTIQGLLNKQRKDMQEKFNSQLEFLENKVKHELSSLQNYVQLCTNTQDMDDRLNITNDHYPSPSNDNSRNHN